MAIHKYSICSLRSLSEKLGSGQDPILGQTPRRLKGKPV